MNRKDFITMCEHLKQYLDSTLHVYRHDDGQFKGIIHPDGLQPVRIRFDHDTNQNDILDKWNTRIKRINWNNIVLICDDKDIDDGDYTRYDNIKEYKKILLTATDLSNKYNWSLQLKAYKDEPHTGTYNGKSLRGGWKFLYMWDFVSFLNS